MPDRPHHFDPIVVGAESTVVAECVPDAKGRSAYQSEAELERHFIKLLQSQAYQYLPIKTEQDLVANLRAQLETLNGFAFSDAEWKRFLKSTLTNPRADVAEKTRIIQEDHIQQLTRDDGSTKNIKLLDKTNIHNNRLQVINQYEVDQTESSRPRSNRYDVTVLVNGLPLVHIELKKRGVQIREAFNQIDRYKRDSFWSGSGLFEYVQLFVISNGTLTKYYSNTTRQQRVLDTSSAKKGASTSNSFEFTSWWADSTNRPITDLVAFTKTFFSKHTILNLLTKYCVFTASSSAQHNRMLLVMRPYQVVATERILQRIDISANYKQLGSIAAGGYVWHTTGSGKTLTSFKAAQLASRVPSVSKVLFVVDRKDLDYQTMAEYDRFEKGAANSNASTHILKKQLEDPEVNIVVTTIQKLSRFISSNKGHKIYNEHVVLIFDECHRSQFGDMHTSIKAAFKNYNLFGFTGTPIFTENAGSGTVVKTTEQVFGDKLHTYTIVDAITDKNVLPFRVDYVGTAKKSAHGSPSRQVSSIDTHAAFMDPRRITEVAKYILENFDRKTKSNHTLPVPLRNFNALFATDSIEAARKYYASLQSEQAHLPASQRLRIGVIYSYAANEEVPDGLLDDEGFDTGQLSEDSRSFLENAMRDYNALFATNFDTSSDGFQNYYKDLALRLKSRELDLVVVVNMFLTGFDATTLNTLFVDKNLHSHGLLQAFSRTNRILNSVKTYGNIVSFRNLEKETNDAIALFGNKDAKGVVLLRPYEEYYGEYQEKVTQLTASYPEATLIPSEDAQKAFITLFGSILRLRNILTSFDDFQDADPLTPRQEQDYRSIYLDLYAELRKNSASDKERINDDLVFEIELVKQVEVNVDYILRLVESHRSEFGNGKDSEVRARITSSVNASPTLRDKKDLIDAFLDSISPKSEVDTEWQSFVAERRQMELESIIDSESLNSEKIQELMRVAFRDGIVPTTGVELSAALPRVSRFSPEGTYTQTKHRVTEKLQAFFERFSGLGTSEW